jgi:hypothetical protein
VAQFARSCEARDANGNQCVFVLDHPGPHKTAAETFTRPESTPSGATITRRYPGKYQQAMADYQRDAADLARTHWYPVNQQYTQGQWGCGAWILAFIALAILVGIIILAYMVAVRPAGELVVTYEYRPPVAPPARVDAPAPVPVADDTMPCPRCAETIKKAAKVCRFCGLELNPAPGAEAGSTIDDSAGT